MTVGVLVRNRIFPDAKIQATPCSLHTLLFPLHRHRCLGIRPRNIGLSHRGQVSTFLALGPLVYQLSPLHYVLSLIQIAQKAAATPGKRTRRNSTFVTLLALSHTVLHMLSKVTPFDVVTHIADRESLILLILGA